MLNSYFNRIKNRRKNRVLKSVVSWLIVIIIMVSFVVMISVGENSFEKILSSNFQLNDARKVMVAIDDTISRNQRVDSIKVVDISISERAALLIKGAPEDKEDIWIYFADNKVWYSKTVAGGKPNANEGTILGTVYGFNVSVNDNVVNYNIVSNQNNSSGTLSNKVALRATGKEN